MAYITPNSEVILLRGVQLDRTHNNSIRFSSTQDQYTYFYAKRKDGNSNYIFNNQSYQRVNENTIRLEKKYDLVYDCNYLMFKNNNGYNGKWYYAFIDSCTYINENCCEISYTIDVIQTYWFDFEFEDCFVEREHTLTDNFGENLVPEELPLGDMTVNKEDIFKFYLGNNTDLVYPDYMYTIIVVYDCSTGQIVDNSTSGHWYDGNPEWASETAPYEGSVVNGFVQGYGYYTFDVGISDDMYVPDTQETYSERASKILSHLVQTCQRGFFLGMLPATIISIYQVPKYFWWYARNNDNKLVSDWQKTITEPTAFKSAKNTGTDYSDVHNKKLYSYPFSYLKIYNNSGEEADYRWEDFLLNSSDGNGQASFNIYGLCIPEPKAFCVPVSHRNVSIDFNDCIIYDSFPTTTWSESSYYQWLGSNVIKLAGIAITGAIAGAKGAIMAGTINSTYKEEKSDIMRDVRKGKKVGSRMSDAYERYNEAKQENKSEITDNVNSTIRGVMNTLSTLFPIKTNLRGEINVEEFIARMKRLQFNFHCVGLKAEIAEIVDKYFDMFGYAIKTVKKPNIKLSGVHLRPKWNYIKTSYAKIQAINGTGFSQDTEEEIESIFNSGITFWESSATIGDYSQQNPPYTPPSPAPEPEQS